MNRALIASAASFAYDAHAQQKRLYTRLPYFTHVYDVAKRVAEVTSVSDAIAAAFLHDTIEDTKFTAADLTRVFGSDVTAIVVELTDVYTDPAHGNRRTRKDLECKRLATVSSIAQTIKLADLIDNTASICIHDRDFAHVYLKEAAALLEVLTRGNLKLLMEARRQLQRFEREIDTSLRKDANARR